MIPISHSKIVVAEVGELRQLLKSPNLISNNIAHFWLQDPQETKIQMPYGYEHSEGIQYSIICKVDINNIIPGKINKGTATYIDGSVVKRCSQWKFIEGDLVFQTLFSPKKCRKPLGKKGNLKLYNGVVQVKTGFVVGYVPSTLAYMKYSINGIVKKELYNFYIIC